MKIRKRRIFRGALLLLLFTLLLSAIWRPPVRAAAEGEAGQEELNQTIEELISSLDVEELQNFLDSISMFGGISVKEKLKAVITGDFALDYRSLTSAVIGLVWEESRTLLPAFALVLAVSLLCGVLNSIKNSFLHSTTSDIIHFVSYLSIGAVVLACLISVLDAGFSAIESMRRQMEIVYPILLTLMAASGGTVSVGIFRPAVAFFSGTVVELFSGIVLPVAVVVIVLAFVGNLTDGVRTGKLAELFKSITKWLIGLTLGLFGLFLTVQGITAAQYDGLSLRAMKYVVSGSVPIVGGFLSGGIEIVVAGSAVIKNALGAFALFLLFGTLLRPLMLIVAFRLFLYLSAAATEPVGGKISVFFSELAKDTGYFLAGLLCVAFLYFLTVVLLICASGVFF